MQTDVTSRDDLRAVVEQTLAEFGRIDTLVNNAGIYRAATTLVVTEEHWDAMMSINAKAVFFATQAALPTMIAQKRGVIVSLASMAGKIGSRANLPYNASKAAVISMTKSLALAHAADGIRVNCVCPGFVETDMWASVAREQGALLNQSPEEFTRRRIHQIPLGRMERPEDVANVIGILGALITQLSRFSRHPRSPHDCAPIHGLLEPTRNFASSVPIGPAGGRQPPGRPSSAKSSCRKPGKGEELAAADVP